MPFRPRSGFTLVELLVVVSIIVVLLAMLLPAMEGAIEEARKAGCASNLHVVHMGVQDYALMSNGDITPPWDVGGGDRLQVGMDTVSVERLSRVGLFTTAREDRGSMDFNSGYMVPYSDRQAMPMWNCPSRGYKSQWEKPVPTWDQHHLILGYQYMGGIDRWVNADTASTSPSTVRRMESFSPIKVPTSRGSWVLAADTTIKLTNNRFAAWQEGRPSAFAGVPSHKLGGNKTLPSGGNQVHMDGSVAWIKFAEMFWYHSWGVSRPAFFYQPDAGGYKYWPAKDYNR